MVPMLSTSCLMAAASVTSSTCVSTPCRLARCSLLISVAITRAPSRANISAEARPMPCAAAVINTVLPARRPEDCDMGFPLNEFALCQILDQRGQSKCPRCDLVGKVDLVHQRPQFGRGDRHDVGDLMRETLSRSEPILRRREHRPQEQHQSVRILVIRTDRMLHQIQRIATDHRHRAAALEREAFCTVYPHCKFGAPYIVN